MIRNVAEFAFYHHGIFMPHENKNFIIIDNNSDHIVHCKIRLALLISLTIPTIPNFMNIVIDL